jgi:uncharacterized glyoxalase superfamily protein PhnB
MAETSVSSVWPILHYDDTNAALRFFVEVFGFEEAIAVTDEDGDVVHAEMRWPGGGAFVFGATKHTDSVHGGMGAGGTALYVITEDVDAVHQRVRQAGGRVVNPPNQTRFGTGAPAYAFTAADSEGNLWTFGTYRGA